MPTETGLLHQHRETTRRPIAAVAAAVAGLMAWFGMVNAAPWYALLPILAALAMALWMLVAARVSGAELTAKTLRLFSGRWERSIPMAAIASYSVTPWSEGADWISLRLKPGEDFRIPSHCLGDAKAFAAALSALGIPRT
jgi:hypothetical protein